jgi:DNA mismatch repair protein MutH
MQQEAILNAKGEPAKKVPKASGKSGHRHRALQRMFNVRERLRKDVLKICFPIQG